MNAAIYCRVSSEEQRERQTIINQRDFAQAHCALHQIPVHDFYLDDGVSGTLSMADRPEGARLLTDAAKQCFDTVLVYKLDRLGRVPRLILNAVNDLEAAGVQVRSMTEPFDTSNPAGRFMLTTLAAVAGFERDTIVERSTEGSNRIAREGAWMGGVPPFGYRVVGKDREARLVVSDEIIPGLNLSEADVVRLIYRLTVDENMSCFQIADHLNSLGVLPVYARIQRDSGQGTRKRVTKGIWRANAVRNLIVSPTYKGLHQYGKRSKRARAIIERPVPPLVSADVWESAQNVLRNHQLFSRRNAKHNYLLRGLMKCDICKRTFTGLSKSYKGKEVRYYVCNGRHASRALLGANGTKCSAATVTGDIEETIWADIEAFLRDPGEILQRLEANMAVRDSQAQDVRAELGGLEQALGNVGRERDTVLALYRKGRIDEATLDRQLDEIAEEEARLREKVLASTAKAVSLKQAEEQLQAAGTLLLELRGRLDGPLTWELRRQLIEALVSEMRVETVVEDGKRDAVVHVTYRFDSLSYTQGHPFTFYQKCGFVIAGVVPDANGRGKPDILMAKRIEPR